MLNNPKAVPSPGSSTLQAALSLIAGLGSGNSKHKSMLEEMRDVQMHNEKVAVELVAGISKLNKDYSQYEQDTKSLQSEKVKHQEFMKKRQMEVDLDRLALEKQRTDLSDDYRVKNNEYNSRYAELVKSESDLARDKESCSTVVSQNDAKLKRLDEREAEVSRGEGQLYNIKEYLKAHI